MSRLDAMKREKWYKSPKGRKFIAELIKRNETNGLFVSSACADGRNLVPHISGTD